MISVPVGMFCMIDYSVDTDVCSHTPYTSSRLQSWCHTPISSFVGVIGLTVYTLSVGSSPTCEPHFPGSTCLYCDLYTGGLAPLRVYVLFLSPSQLDGSSKHKPETAEHLHLKQLCQYSMKGPLPSVHLCCGSTVLGL